MSASATGADDGAATGALAGAAAGMVAGCAAAAAASAWVLSEAYWSRAPSALADGPGGGSGWLSTSPTGAVSDVGCSSGAAAGAGAARGAGAAAGARVWLGAGSLASIGYWGLAIAIGACGCASSAEIG